MQRAFCCDSAVYGQCAVFGWAAHANGVCRCWINVHARYSPLHAFEQRKMVHAFLRWSYEGKMVVKCSTESLSAQGSDPKSWQQESTFRLQSRAKSQHELTTNFSSPKQGPPAFALLDKNLKCATQFSARCIPDTLPRHMCKKDPRKPENRKAEGEGCAWKILSSEQRISLSRRNSREPCHD